MAEVKQGTQHSTVWFLIGGGFFRGWISAKGIQENPARTSDANMKISFGDWQFK